jgi:hypothetical protein
VEIARADLDTLSRWSREEALPGSAYMTPSGLISNIPACAYRPLSVLQRTMRTLRMCGKHAFCQFHPFVVLMHVVHGRVLTPLVLIWFYVKHKYCRFILNDVYSFVYLGVKPKM